jgi:hypothetical protein
MGCFQARRIEPQARRYSKQRSRFVDEDGRQAAHESLMSKIWAKLTARPFKVKGKKHLLLRGLLGINEESVYPRNTRIGAIFFNANTPGRKKNRGI